MEHYKFASCIKTIFFFYLAAEDWIVCELINTDMHLYIPIKTDSLPHRHYLQIVLTNNPDRWCLCQRLCLVTGSGQGWGKIFSSVSASDDPCQRKPQPEPSVTQVSARGEMKGLCITAGEGAFEHLHCCCGTDERLVQIDGSSGMRRGER